MVMSILVNILFNNLYLHYDENLNQVFFTNNGKQKWIIEYESPFYYIKSAIKYNNHICYLGSPNKNNNIYLLNLHYWD